MPVRKLSDVQIGEIVKIKENGNLTDFLVLCQGYPTASDMNTLLIRNTIYGRSVWGSSENYSISTADSFLSNNYLPIVDSEIANHIPLISLPCYGGNINRKVFLLSVNEVSARSVNNEGTHISYFSSEIRRTATLNGAATEWWLRTIIPESYSTGAYYIDSSGRTQGGIYTKSQGIRPAFALPQSLSVGEDGTVFVNQLPTTPISISVPDIIVSGNPVYITWAQSSDPEGGAVSYELERADDDGSFVQIYAGANPVFTDEGVAAGVSSVQYRVRAKDNKNAYSAYCTSDKRSVVHNSNPTISGEDTDLGSLTKPPSFEFTVNDADSQGSLIITEYIDDIAVKRIEDAEREKPYVFSLSKAQFYGLGNGQHTMKIVVADSLGGTAERIITFSRSISGIEYICGPFETDAPAEKILLSLSYIADVSNFSVYVCNNGFDDVPSWEEAGLVIKHIFSNQSKTAEKWGVAVKVVISKSGDAGQISSGPISGSYI